MKREPYFFFYRNKQGNAPFNFINLFFDKITPKGTDEYTDATKYVLWITNKRLHVYEKKLSN